MFQVYIYVITRLDLIGRKPGKGNSNKTRNVNSIRSQPRCTEHDVLIVQQILAGLQSSCSSSLECDITLNGEHRIIGIMGVGNVLSDSSINFILCFTFQLPMSYYLHWDCLVTLKFSKEKKKYIADTRSVFIEIVV